MGGGSQGKALCHRTADVVSFMVLKPSIPPSKPTQTTTAAVSEGMPPSDLVTSMAIGVVTDLGARE